MDASNIPELSKIDIYSSSKKNRTQKALSFLALLIFLLCFHEAYGQVSPGGATYDIEFWLRADYVHVPASQPQEGEEVPVWITVASKESDPLLHNHWGLVPLNGTSTTSKYAGPTMSYDGMNFYEAVEFNKSATQKLGSQFPIPTNNNTSYYMFFVSELNTAKTTGSYASILTLGGGYGYNGHGWRGSGIGFWWTNETSSTYANTLEKSYGISSFIRTNNSNMVLYHNGKRFEGGSARTGSHREHGFIGNHGLDSNPFYGKMQEIIMFSRSGNHAIDNAQLRQIHTYLAVKYGQTLDSIDQPDWHAANGAKIWEGSKNPGYKSGMFGLACDKGTNLFQKQGRSADDKKLTAFLGNTLYGRNSENRTSLRPDSLTSYLIFGHNGLLEGNTGYFYANKNYQNGEILTDDDIRLRSNLIYKAQATFCPAGNTTAVTSYTVSLQTGFAAQYIMVSPDAGFNPSNTRLYPLTNNTANNVLINDGDYIGFLVAEQGPGGVTTQLKMWLKADDASNISIVNNNEVNEWRNSSENNVTYRYIQSNLESSVSNSRPKYKVSDKGMNYHPALDFNPSTCQTKYPFLSSTNAIFSKDIPDYYTIIIASNLRNYGVKDNYTTEEVSYFIGFGATTPGSGNSGDGEARKPAMGVAKGIGGIGAARFYSNGSIDGSKDLFNPNATSITLFEVSTPSSNRYIQFESDGYEEIMTVSGTNIASSTYSKLTGSSMLGIASRRQRQMDGTMGEVIAFEGKLSNPDKQKLYSYLGLKYGITLDLNKTSATVNYDYLLSDGTVVWPGSSSSLYQTYHNNVAGLVKDNTSSLNNTQARSTNTGAIVRIGIGESLGENAILRGLNNNMESLMWGNNGKGTGLDDDSTEILYQDNDNDNCAGLERRMRRVWMLDNTNTQENYPLLISAGGEQSANTFPYYTPDYQVYLVVAKSADKLSDNGSPADWTMIPGTYIDGEHHFIYTIPANTDYLYFTFAAKKLPGICESCGFEGEQKLEFTKSLWPNSTTTKTFSGMPEISPSVSLEFINNGTGAAEAKFYPNNPRSYAGKTLRITRMGASAPTMKTTIDMEKAAMASFSIYEIDRRASLYDEITVYGLCDDNRYYPNLYYGGNSKTSSYAISGNKATANSRTSASLSAAGKMNVEFSEPVESIVIEHKVTGAATGWKRIGLSPIEFSCPVSIYNVNEDGLAFRKGAPREVMLCEDVQFTYKIYNAECREKAVAFSDMLPAGMYWVENSLSIGEYNESHVGFNVNYETDLTAGASALSIDSLYIPGGGEITFFATARFVSDLEAQQLSQPSPAPGEYPGKAYINYVNASATVVELGSCDMRHTGCSETVVVALASDIPTPVTALMTSANTTYSEEEEITVRIDVENKNADLTNTTLSVSYNEEFTYVTGSLLFGSTNLTPIFDTDMPGSFSVNGLTLISNTPNTIEFKLKAPVKTVLANDGKGGILPLGVEYSMETESEDVCASCVLADANGNLNIPYQEILIISVTGVSLNETTLSLVEGNTETLIATVAPDNATNKDVTWESNNSAVTVSDSGEITAVAPGTATITVTTVDGSYTATCTVTVSAVAVPVTGVSLNETTLSLVEGNTETLIATVAPDNATNKDVTWESNNSAVTVSDSGEIIAVAPGTATITVTTVDGSYTATCTVTVSAATVPVTGVSLNETALSLVEGNTETLIATVAPGNATNKDVTWESNNNSAVTVSDSGEIIAVAPGTATITVTTVDGSYTAICVVIVTGSGSTPIITHIIINKHITNKIEE